MSEKAKSKKPKANQPKERKNKKKPLNLKEKILGGGFSLGENPMGISSSETLGTREKPALNLNAEAQEDADHIADSSELDPIFKELGEPTLPEPPKENRARLQMQSPTRLYFYWSVKNNPFQTLNKVFGGQTGNYSLVAKLINKTDGTEDVFPVDAEGNWWFNVKSDSDYRAEIGFYAPNRPYIRVMFSNEIHTPRRSPSKRTDYTPSFSMNAYQFAEVLDVSGYRRDAIEVAVAGDNTESADSATRETYFQLAGKKFADFGSRYSEKLRFVFLALASGHSLDDIRNEVDPVLYEKLKADFEGVNAAEVLSALKNNFDVFSDEFFEEEEIGSAVYGASLVNFPKKLSKRMVPQSLLPRLKDLSNPESLSSFRNR